MADSPPPPNPKYPVYIVSKGRWDSRLTVKALEKRNIPYHIVVEPQEYEQYAAVINPANIYVLPFGNLGQGSIPARNWVWDHAAAQGAAWHWILDDNIRDFYRLHKNIKYCTTDGLTFRIIEEFVERYENIALAGMQYDFFTVRKKKHPPFILNTRIYSCILIRTDIPYRWRGKYNEDTDLSLRVLKDGWCTVLFYAFTAKKMATMRMRGGNTDTLYKLPDGRDGRLLMAQSLQQQHPDVARITWKWGRWQHHVDYRRFRSNQLIRKRGLVLPSGPQEFGMRLLGPDDPQPHAPQQHDPFAEFAALVDQADQADQAAAQNQTFQSSTSSQVHVASGTSLATAQREETPA